MNWTRSENYSLRSPQALHKVRAPSGPRRHSGVSVVLHEWHLGLPVARFCTHFSISGHTNVYNASELNPLLWEVPLPLGVYIVWQAMTTCCLDCVDRCDWRHSHSPSEFLSNWMKWKDSKAGKKGNEKAGSELCLKITKRPRLPFWKNACINSYSITYIWWSFGASSVAIIEPFVSWPWWRRSHTS